MDFTALEDSVVVVFLFVCCCFLLLFFVFFFVKAQKCLAHMEASLLMQCIITGKQSNQINTMMKQRKGLMTQRQSELKKSSS